VNSTGDIRWDQSLARWIQEGNPTECALLQFIHDLECGDMSSPTYKKARTNPSFQTTDPQTGNSRLGIADIPFSSRRKRAAWVVPRPGGGCRMYLKGASEIVLALCSRQMNSDGSCTALLPESKVIIEREIIAEQMAKQAMRTIGLAYRDFDSVPQDWTASSEHPGLGEVLLVEQGLVLLGIAGIEDPLRPEVPGAIEKVNGAGVDVRMVTGDNLDTAIAIAKKCHILRPQDLVRDSIGDLVPRPLAAMTGAEFRAKVLEHVPDPSGEKGSDGKVKMVVKKPEVILQDKFDEIWPHLRVLARSSPMDKYVLASGLNESLLFACPPCRERWEAKKDQLMQEAAKAGRTKEYAQVVKDVDLFPCPECTRTALSRGVYPDRQVVAMTGDGTNDAPALKRADVGFGMGAGTEVAKSASDIVLLNDSFGSIVTACLWGRNVYDAIAKFLQFQLTVNVVAVSLVLIGAFAHNASPISAVQMLWVNLIMDSFASLALATEPPTDVLLERAPYGRHRNIISGEMFVNIASQAALHLTVACVLLFQGPDLLNIPAGSTGGHGAPASRHYTIVFNSFVCLTLFNFLNSRKLYHERNILSGITENIFFGVIVISCFVLQVLIVQFGGHAFKVVALTGRDWAVCVGLGMLSLPWYQLTVAVVSLLGLRRKPVALSAPEVALPVLAKGDMEAGELGGFSSGRLSNVLGVTASPLDAAADLVGQVSSRSLQAVLGQVPSPQELSHTQESHVVRGRKRVEEGLRAAH